MSKKRRKKGKNKPQNILQSQENNVNLPSQETYNFKLIDRNINQLWDWNTLENIKFD